MDELQRHRREHVRVDRRVRQVDEFQAELLGEDRQQDFFLDEPLIDENLVRRELGGGLDGVGGADCGRRRRAGRGGERFEQLHGVLLRGVPGVTAQAGRRDVLERSRF